MHRCVLGVLIYLLILILKLVRFFSWKHVFVRIHILENLVSIASLVFKIRLYILYKHDYFKCS